MFRHFLIFKKILFVQKYKMQDQGFYKNAGIDISIGFGLVRNPQAFKYIHCLRKIETVSSILYSSSFIIHHSSVCKSNHIIM